MDPSTLHIAIGATHPGLVLLTQKYLLWIADLEKNEIGPNMKWTKVINEFDASYAMLVPLHTFSAAGL